MRNYIIRSSECIFVLEINILKKLTSKCSNMWLLNGNYICSGIIIFCILLYTFINVTNSSTLPMDSTDLNIYSSSEYINKLLNDLDETQDKCTNFYGYVCGKWLRRNLKTNGKTTSYLNENFDKMLKDIVMETPSVSENTLELKKARRIQKACMDKGAIDKRGLQPIIKVINQYGGWPLLTQFPNTTSFSWQELDANYTQLVGSPAFFDIKVIDNIMGGQTYLILDIPLLFGKPGNLINFLGITQDVFPIYIQLVLNIIFSLHEEVNSSIRPIPIISDAINMIRFELRLLQIIQSKVPIYEQRYSIISIAELQEEYDRANVSSNVAQINWVHLLNSYYKEVTNVKLYDENKIQLRSHKYLYELAQLLNETPHKIVVNYIHWRFIMNMIPYTSTYMKEIWLTIQNIIFREEPVRKERYHECLKDNPMKHVFYHEFVKRHFTQEIKDVVTNITMNLQNVLHKEIIAMKLTHKVERVLRNMIKSAPPYINTLKDYKNITTFKQYYHLLKVSDLYFENVLAINTWKFRMNGRKLTGIVDEIELLTESVFETPDIYETNSRVLEFSAAVLLQPLFDISFPFAFNYAGLGVFLGFRIFNLLHAKLITTMTYWFENAGRIYTENINCFLQQIKASNNHTSDSSKKNSAEDLRKYLFSWAGVNAAYISYHDILQKHPEKQIPILRKFSTDQIFFIAYARVVVKNYVWASWLLKNIRKIYRKNLFRLKQILGNQNLNICSIHYTVTSSYDEIYIIDWHITTLMFVNHIFVLFTRYGIKGNIRNDFSKISLYQ